MKLWISLIFKERTKFKPINSNINKKVAIQKKVEAVRIDF